MEVNFITKEAWILQRMMKNRIDKIPIKKLGTPTKTIEHLAWPEPPAIVSNKQAIAWDTDLDCLGSLGKLATSISVIEKLFPACHLKVAEVIKSQVVEFMLEIPYSERDDVYMQKILAHETISLLAIIDGQQYDIQNQAAANHPHLKEFAAWEGIAAWRMISEASQHPARQQIDLLLKIKRFCPSTLINYNLVSLYLEINEMAKSIEAAQELLEERPQAVIYYVLYLLTSQAKYKEDLRDIYGPSMFNFINKKYLND